MLSSEEKLQLTKKIPILDRGYIRYIGHMGYDEDIVESARMSTGKGFFGWYWEKDTYADCACNNCLTQHIWDTLPIADDGDADAEFKGEKLCTSCWEPQVFNFSLQYDLPSELKKLVPKLMGKKDQPRDFSLLETLYSQRHSTPFESGELMVEVYAPIMVYREWHRHRSQSYNEFSARYAQMPNHHYVPSVERMLRSQQSKTNKQGSEDGLDEYVAHVEIDNFKYEQQKVYQGYKERLEKGVSKEVARINTPVSRYSKMRAKANLRNWLWFLGLRMEKGAQWEIRQYANEVAGIIKTIWPRTFDLFIEHDFLAVRFSRSEMTALRKLLGNIARGFSTEEAREYTGIGPKKIQAFIDKIMKPKEDDYRDVLAKLGY